eukprot:6481030-Amphidinium_carterae.2
MSLLSIWSETQENFSGFWKDNPCKVALLRRVHADAEGPRHEALQWASVRPPLFVERVWSASVMAWSLGQKQ